MSRSAVDLRHLVCLSLSVWTSCQLLLLPVTFGQERKSVVKKVRGISHVPHRAYSRVIIDLEAEVSFRHQVLRSPDRIFVDLYDAVLSPALEKGQVNVGDGTIKAVRVAQNQPNMVRVVVDLEGVANYNISFLRQPPRMVVDIQKVEAETAGLKPPSTALSRGEKQGMEDGSPVAAAKVAKRPRRIVIDPGHGGKDPGAIGRNGLMEKQVAFQVATLLREIIVKQTSYEAILTRRSDEFLPLGRRTAMANSLGADLFISIHANASPNLGAHGIETYLLNFATDESARQTAARENMVSLKQMSDLELILKDLILTSKINESTALAHLIQRALVSDLRTVYPDVKDLGVKQAPFYVLIGAHMPSVLIEVSFISNPKEGQRLSTRSYLERMAQAIFKGIQEYLTQEKVVAISLRK